ncbi:ADP-ribosylglycohydrolase family protein [candidate division KSB1 bacterium]|nr:ADP-ribosylglycohydrolase family protein [candidate division KSB1 bacterium]
MKKSAMVFIGCGLLILLFGCQQVSYREITVEDYVDKMKAGWIGQMAGVGWGGPTEFRWNSVTIPEEHVPEWKPEMINQHYQDDIYVEMTFLRTLELYGFDVDIRQAGIDFANSRYMLWHANKAGRDNLRAGIAPPWSGHPKFNSHSDDIDYQIEADYSGLIAPGLPQAVVDLGELFGRLMNYGDGVYGGQFVAGMYAEAFFTTDIHQIIEAGLACIPEKSVYAEMIRDVTRWYQENPDEWIATWNKIEAKYQDNPDYRKFSCSGPEDDFNINATINGAYIVMGLLYGKGDLDKTIVISMRCGQDSDCNPSNAAGVLATAMGASELPDKFTSAIDSEPVFSFTDYNFASLTKVCEKLARQAVVRYGGKIQTNDEGNEVFLIPVKAPILKTVESCWEAGPVPENVHFSEKEMEQITIKIRPKSDFINSWQISGPYSKKGVEGFELFDVSFKPERNPKQAKWQVYPTDKLGEGVVDFSQLMRGEHRAAYLKTRIWSPETRNAVIELGSDDGIKIWLNHKLVHANNVTRGYTESEETVDVQLKNGWNEMLVKVTQGTGGWEAGLVITDTKRKVFKDIRFE